MKFLSMKRVQKLFIARLEDVTNIVSDSKQTYHYKIPKAIVFEDGRIIELKDFIRTAVASRGCSVEVSDGISLTIIEMKARNSRVLSYTIEIQRRTKVVKLIYTCGSG